MHISQNLHSSKSEEMILCEMWKSILEFSVELHMVVSTHDEVPLLPGLTGNDPTNIQNRSFSGSNLNLSDRSDFNFFNDYW